MKQELACVLGVVIAAVVAPAENAPKDPAPPPERRVFEDYLAKDDLINVRAGQRFSIRLRSNPTTGYAWMLDGAPDSNLVNMVTNVFEAPPDDGLVGAGGHEIWTFKARKAGETRVTLRYARPWEKGADPQVVTNAWRIRISADNGSNTNSPPP